MLSLLVSVLVLTLIFGLLWWVVGFIPLPQPFLKIAQVVIVVIFVIWLICLLLPLAGLTGPELLPARHW